jgi:fructokinase
MIIVIGEILIDIFPEYERIGGAPFNVACHLQRLGWPVRFFTRVGEDRNGRKILSLLERCGFDTADVQRDAVHPTGTVRVTLDDAGVPQFDIRSDVAYDHLDLDGHPRFANAGVDATLVYFGTLLQRTDDGRRTVQHFLNRCCPSATRFCDINLRPPHVSDDAIVASLQQADLLKLSADELVDLQQRLGAPADVLSVLRWLMDRFAIHTAALTSGEQGSRLVDASGEYHVAAEPVPRVVDTVGAGDGYAAVLAAGMLKGLPWEGVMRQASDFAARLCGIAGAIPDNASFYDGLHPLMKGTGNGR